MASPRWKKELEALEAEIQKEYPDLRLVETNGELVFKGSFPIRHEGEDLDRFLIEISFPDGPARLPVVHEIGGRIPRISDRHVNERTGDLCVDVPELIQLRGENTLLRFLNGPVRNFLISQHLVEKGDPWPFGQWEHGKPGLIQAYGEILGFREEPQIRRFLDLLSHKKIKAHWPCPCGSGRPIRSCHDAEIRALQILISTRVARDALRRLSS